MNERADFLGWLFTPIILIILTMSAPFAVRNWQKEVAKLWRIWWNER